MPRLRKPLSAIDRLVLLKKAVETAESDRQNGGSHLSESTCENIARFIPGLENGLGEIGKAASTMQKEIREKNSSQEDMKTAMRDFWEVLRRRVYRNKLPQDVFAYYQLPKSGHKPELTTEGQWFETCELIIKGEADAVQAGYEPMLNPDISELREKLDKARTEAADVSNADKQLDEAQEAVSDLMPEAKKLTDRIIAELDFNLYEKDDAGKRRIMRNYGVRYELTRNEISEDDSDISPE